MTGADKIIETITQDGAAASEEILAAAKQQAQAILAQAKAQAAQASREALEQAQAKAAFEEEAAHARAPITEKRALLQAKNEVIAQVITSAAARLNALPAAEYFAVLAKLAAQHAQPGHGAMRLSQRDLERLPADFAAALADIEISPQPADIANGFVLAYGDIEQNCTFDALIAAQLDDIKDALNNFIFN